MDPAKFIELQSQIRTNQTELQDYLKDLDNFEKEIQLKENALKESSSGVVKDSAKILPPIRNSLLQRKVKKRKSEPASKPKPIPGSDFRSWDKFDVDKALTEIDKNDPPSEYETDEEWEAERKKQQALMEKDLGNRCYKENKFEEAVVCYTKAIECDPTNALFYSNRAMALLKLQRFKDVEHDCNEAICLDPGYVKTYLRRATSRRHLGKLSEALDDCQLALRLEPDNRDAQKEADVIKQQMAEPSRRPGLVLPVKKPLQERSKKPLKRIAVEEIGAETVAEAKQQAEELRQRRKQDVLAASTAGRSGTARAHADAARDEATFDRLSSAPSLSSSHAVFERQPTSCTPTDTVEALLVDATPAVAGRHSFARDGTVSSANVGKRSSPVMDCRLGNSDADAAVAELVPCVAADATTPATTTQQSRLSSGTVVADRAADHQRDVQSAEMPLAVDELLALPAAHRAAVSSCQNLSNTAQPAALASSDKSKVECPRPSAVPAGSASRRVLTAAAASSVSSSPPAFKVPAPPDTFYRLAVDWKLVRGNLDWAYSYVKQISPSSYPKMFGELLDSDMLVTLLRIFSERFLPAGEDVSEHLRWLARVKRFDTVIMLLSAPERAVVSQTFERLPPSISSSDELRAKYGLLSP